MSDDIPPVFPQDLKPIEGPTPSADAIADAINEPVVTFRGYLSSPQLVGDKSVRRLYTSPWFDQWLEIEHDDIRYQQRGIASADASSIIWVRRTAMINRCARAEACHFAEQEAELEDPTEGPRYGGRRP